MIDSIVCWCQNSQHPGLTHLFSWDLRSCVSNTHSDCASFCKSIHVLCACMCAFVRVCVQLLLCAAQHGIWLPALSMSEVWARLSMLPSVVTGTSLVCRSPTRSGLAAHKVSVIKNNLCHLQPFEAHLVKLEWNRTPLCFAAGCWMVTFIACGILWWCHLKGREENVSQAKIYWIKVRSRRKNRVR